jgi:hypothetical protein
VVVDVNPLGWNTSTLYLELTGDETVRARLLFKLIVSCLSVLATVRLKSESQLKLLVQGGELDCQVLG